MIEESRLDKTINGLAVLILYGMAALFFSNILLFGGGKIEFGFACNEFWCLITPKEFYFGLWFWLTHIPFRSFLFYRGYSRGFSNAFGEENDL